MTTTRTRTRDDRFTADDYAALPEGFPAQLLDGGLVKEPHPGPGHQCMVVALLLRLLAVTDRRRVLVAPCDVFLDRWNVLQPDLLVLPEHAPVSVKARRAALPVLVIEVASPGTARRDRGAKCRAYLRTGVGEVWLVDPDAGTIEVRTRDGSQRFAGDEEAASAVLPGFRVSWRSLAE